MFFGKAKVDKVDALLIVLRPSHHKVGRLDVSMDNSNAVNAFDSGEHLLKDIDCYRRREVASLRLFKIRQVLAFELHDDEALFAGLHLRDELMHLDNALLALKFLQVVVLTEENLFGLVWLLHLESNIAATLIVCSVIDDACKMEN